MFAGAQVRAFIPELQYAPLLPDSIAHFGIPLTRGVARAQVTFLQEVQYCCCYYFGGHFKTRNGLACTDNGTYKRMLYVMAILPYWCRFAQVRGAPCRFAWLLAVRNGRS